MEELRRDARTIRAMPQSSALAKTLPQSAVAFQRSSALSKKLRLVAISPEFQSTMAEIPPHIREALEPLNAKKRIFSIVRATGQSQAESFRLAVDHLRESKEYAWTDAACQTSGKEYEADPLVATAIAVIRAWNDTDWCLDGANCREFIFTRLAEIAETAPAAIARQATMDLAKLHGLVVSKSEIKHIEETPDDMLASLVGFFDTMEATTPMITSETFDADILG